MLLTRVFDADAANRAVNHPDVRPFVGPAELGELNFEEVIAERQNWFLMGEYGGFALAWSAPGVYEVHVFILPEGRGKWAAQARQEMVDYAKAHGATMLWARISPAARVVAYFARRGGMQPTGEMIYTFGSPYDLYKMEL